MCVVKISYVIVWTPDSYDRRRLLQSINKDAKEELILNYTSFINMEESVEDIEIFMDSIDVSVETVGPTVPGNDSLTNKPSVSLLPSLSPSNYSSVSINPSPNPAYSPINTFSPTAPFYPWGYFPPSTLNPMTNFPTKTNIPTAT